MGGWERIADTLQNNEHCNNSIRIDDIGAPVPKRQSINEKPFIVALVFAVVAGCFCVMFLLMIFLMMFLSMVDGREERKMSGLRLTVCTESSVLVCRSMYRSTVSPQFQIFAFVVRTLSTFM